MTQALAAYGKMANDAVEPVGGWYCIRILEIPACAGKLAHYGGCVAMVGGYELACQMAAAPKMQEALERSLEVFESISAMGGVPHSDALDITRQALRLAKHGIRASATAMLAGTAA